MTSRATAPIGGDLDGPSPPGMRWIPGGTFAMGSDDFYPEERPVHRVSVDGFWMDATPVTAAEFRRFVRETGYVTVAERPLDAALYPDADPELLVPGSLVFRMTSGPGRPRRQPQLVGVRAGRLLEAAGREGNDDQRPRPTPGRPVAYEDAEAYASWAGKELPSEAEWEYAARGGLDGAVFAWGDEHFPDGKRHGQHLAGRVPLAEPEARRLRGNLAGRQLPPERLRPPRHDRQRLGVDVRLVHAAHPDEVESPCCAPRNPRVSLGGAPPRQRRSRAA